MENLIFTLALGDRGFAMDFVRNIFAKLDSVAFFLFAKVMEVMFEIADVTSKANLSEFLGPLQSRIYVILSIYMLFKVTVSLITYVVNPDAMTDKSQGVGQLVQRIVIALILLIFFPYAFSFLNTFQSHIISNNTIPKLVLGSGGSYSDAAGIGNEIAYSVYNGTFIYAGEPGIKVESDSATVESVIEHVNDPGASRSEYANGYIFLAGFAVGIVLTVLTLSMCIDVAMRVFKLMILQLVAPIPILSYIDPKASKDGAFSKWLKMTVQVWLEVFLRLFTIYFILLVIERLINAGGLLFDGNNLFVKIALIIGLLFFAKDAPKFIYDALGIKAPERGMFAGMGNILAAGAIGAGAISGGVAGFSASRLAAEANHKNPKLLKNIGAGLFGAAGGITTGIGAATKAKDHNARAVMEAMSKRNDAAIAAGAAGSTAFGRAMSMGSRIITGQTPAMKLERKIAKMEAQKNALSNVKSRMSGEMVKQNWTRGVAGSRNADGNWEGLTSVNGESIETGINYKDFMARKNAASAAGASSFIISSENQEYEISMADAERYQGLILKNNEDDYIQRATGEVYDEFSGEKVFGGDSTLNQLIDIATSTGATVSDRKSVTSVVDDLGIQITNAKSQNETNKQNDRFAGKK